jgi:hypothetical protein
MAWPAASALSAFLKGLGKMSTLISSSEFVNLLLY